MAKKPTFKQVKTSPFAVRPSKDTALNPLADLGELGGGAIRVAKQGVDYLRRSTPQKVSSDAVSVAKGLYDQVAADPVKFGLDTLAAGPQAMVDFAQARGQAQKLRASGELDAARKLEEGAASILLGAIPAVGKAAKAGKVVEKDAARLIEEYGDDWVAPIGHNNPPSAKKPVAKKVDTATRLLTKYPEARSVRPA